MGLAIAFAVAEGLFVLLCIGALAAIVVVFRKKPLIALLASLCVISVYFWSLFPTVPVHRSLCAKRSGERVFETVRAGNYFLVGEGGDEHGRVGAETAMLDVAEGRAAFVEIVKLPDTIENQLQRSILRRFADTAGIDWEKATAFRVEVRKKGSPGCVWSPGSPWAVPTRISNHFSEAACISFTHAPKLTSRYGVQLYRRKPAWYAPEIEERGIQVVDSQGGRILGEFAMFSRAPRVMVVLLIGEQGQMCPSPYETRTRIQLQHLHRKVLFNSR